MKTYTKALIPRARQMRRAMTRAELHLWVGLLRDFEPRIRRQRPVAGFIVDFYCAMRKTIIEVDGGQHFTPEGLMYDAERTAILESLGLRVLRFSNNEVLQNFEGVCAQIRTALLETSSLSSSSPAK